MADLNRKTAYQTLLEIEKNQAYSNLELNDQIRKEKPDNPAFVRELVYGVVENKIYLDYILSQLIPKGLKGVKKPVKVLLRMGLYQIIFMDSVPAYAAVNETIRLARKAAPGRDGFLNGVLRGYEKKKESLRLPDREKDLIGYFSVKYSYDPSIVSLWLSQFTEEETERLLSASNMRPKLSIRVNLMKTTTTELAQHLEEQGFLVEKGSLSHRVLFVTGSGLLEMDAYKKGLFSVQDEASVLTADLMETQPGETVLDICAAPGGKSLAMAESMENQGCVLAFDIYQHKLDLLRKESVRLCIRNIDTAEQDGTVCNNRYLGFADKVLVDGPCSGLGVIRRKPEIKYKAVENCARDLAEKQLRILENACQYVKVGGTLIYSTCTINAIENDQVTDAFLTKHPEYELDMRRQLLPGIDETDGFYICKMYRR